MYFGIIFFVRCLRYELSVVVPRMIRWCSIFEKTNCYKPSECVFCISCAGVKQQEQKLILAYYEQQSRDERSCCLLSPGAVYLSSPLGQCLVQWQLSAFRTYWFALFIGRRLTTLPRVDCSIWLTASHQCTPSLSWGPGVTKLSSPAHTS